MTVLSSVPLEIASHIFAFYLERIHSLVHSPLESRKAPPGPLLPSGVCKKWQQIVHSMPQLWVSVHIHAGHYYTTPLDKVRQQLRRSGQLPLAISFYCRTPYSFRRFEVIDFVKALAPHWGVLKLIMDQTHYATLFNGVIESPHLEKLHIHSHSEGEHYPSVRRRLEGGPDDERKGKERRR